MKAAVYERYGPPEDVLSIRDVPAPVPGDGQVLIRVVAAALNSWDWDQLYGTPQGKLGAGNRIRNPILGADVAGVVEAAGPGVTRFKAGDAVFGELSQTGWGGLAEYAVAAAKYLALKPESMSFEDAAAIPQAGMLALQGLSKRPIGPGDRVLINGGGGGVGTFAIQMAKLAGAEVTGVDRAMKAEVMTSAGADHVIDYEREDFAKIGQRHDVILDMVASRPMTDYVRCLNRGGALAIIGGKTPVLLSAVTWGSLLSLVSGRRLRLVIYWPKAEDLEELARLHTDGTVRPVIGGVLPLERVGEAFRLIGDGRAIGKLVIRVAA